MLSSVPSVNAELQYACCLRGFHFTFYSIICITVRTFESSDILKLFVSLFKPNVDPMIKQEICLRVSFQSSVTSTPAGYISMSHTLLSSDG